MKRREFCRQLTMAGGAVVLGPLLNSCASAFDPPATREAGLAPTSQTLPTNTPRPTNTPQAAPTTVDPTLPPPTPTESATEEPTLAPTVEEASLATVALVKTRNRTEGVQQAIQLLGLNPVRGERVLLKPNYNSAQAPPASTHIDTLRSLAVELEEMGARSITLGERSGMGSTRSVLEEMGVVGLAGELGFDTVVFDELEEKDWVVRQSRDFHWASGIPVPKILLDSPCVVQTCCLKTHRYGGHFTLALKNSVGFVARTVESNGYNYMSELHDSPYQRHMIAEINKLYTPSLIVLDGVDAFLDGGPASGKLAHPSLMLAGTDPVAIDAVGVAILRLFGTTPEVSKGSIFEQEQIARAVELGLGIDAAQRINIVTGDAESEAYAGLVREFLV